MIPGQEVEIGGTKYTLPPLNIASLRKHKDFLSRSAEFASGASLPGVDDVLKMTEIIRDSFARNYPDTSFASLEDHIDIAKLSECFLAIMRVNGTGPATGEKKPGSQ